MAEADEYGPGGMYESGPLAQPTDTLRHRLEQPPDAARRGCFTQGQ